MPSLYQIRWVGCQPKAQATVSATSIMIALPYQRVVKTYHNARSYQQSVSLHGDRRMLSGLPGCASREARQSISVQFLQQFGFPICDQP